MRRNETRHKQSETALETAKGPLRCSKLSWTLTHKWLKIAPSLLPTLSIPPHCQPSYALQDAFTWRRTANLNETASGFFAAQGRCLKKILVRPLTLPTRILLRRISVYFWFYFLLKFTRTFAVADYKSTAIEDYCLSDKLISNHSHENDCNADLGFELIDPCRQLTILWQRLSHYIGSSSVCHCHTKCFLNILHDFASFFMPISNRRKQFVSVFCFISDKIWLKE